MTQWLSRNKLIVAIILVVGAFLVYRFVPIKSSEDQVSNAAREVSAVATYEAPGGTDVVRFTLGLDGSGAVVAVRSTDARNDTTDENLEKFSTNLLLVIRGKKLSDLGPVDRVGKSSLTTAAFNAVLPELKAQL